MWCILGGTVLGWVVLGSVPGFASGLPADLEQGPALCLSFPIMLPTSLRAAAKSYRINN